MSARVGPGQKVHCQSVARGISIASGSKMNLLEEGQLLVVDPGPAGGLWAVQTHLVST